MQDSLRQAGGYSETEFRKKYRWHYDELNCTNNAGFHMPKWGQSRHNVYNWLTGCAPTALGMVYAYHAMFRGKTQLFGGWVLYNRVYPGDQEVHFIEDFIFQIGYDCHAKFGVNGTSVNLNDLENGGDAVADGVGYDCHLDQDYGGDFSKGKRGYQQILNENPFLVYFSTNGSGEANHEGAVEGVKWSEVKYVWNWYNSEMWYLVNYGHSGVRNWLCMDSQMGSSEPKVTNSGNMYCEFR